MLGLLVLHVQRLEQFPDVLDRHIDALDRLIAPTSTHASPAYKPRLALLAHRHLGVRRAREHGVEALRLDVQAALERREHGAAARLAADLELAQPEAELHGARVVDAQRHADGRLAAAAGGSEGSAAAEVGGGGRRRVQVRDGAGGLDADRGAAHARQRHVARVREGPRAHAEARAGDGGAAVLQRQHDAGVADGRLHEGLQRGAVGDAHELVLDGDGRAAGGGLELRQRDVPEAAARPAQLQRHGREHRFHGPGLRGARVEGDVEGTVRWVALAVM